MVAAVVAADPRTVAVANAGVLLAVREPGGRLPTNCPAEEASAELAVGERAEVDVDGRT